jgi:hypothetical protein
MATTAPTTQKTYRVSLTVDGEDWGVWDTKTGGKVGANILTYLPGGMGPQIALPGGAPTIDTVSLSRIYDRVRDHPRLGTLLDRIGKARCVVKQRPLDADGNGSGKSIVWRGTLASADPPATDGNSDTAALITVEIAPEGPVTLA